MPFDGPTVAEAVESVIRQALTPIVARLRVLEARLDAEENEKTLDLALSSLRARVLELESKAAIPGPAGPAGADGLGFTDYHVEYDGERTFKHVWTSGDRRVEKAFRVPVMIYRGLFVPGKVYEAGDVVTVNGSMFTCNADTMRGPGDGSKDWTLSVKRGKDDRGRSSGNGDHVR